MDECLIHQYPDLEQNHFWWVSRRELIRRLLEDVTHSGDLEVLDVGCGSGVLARELAATGAKVAATDLISHPDWDTFDPPEFSDGDYLELSSGLGLHDVVLALDVMEHFEDDRAFARCLRDNVRPGGTGIVTVPAYNWLWSDHDQMNHHFRRYTRSTLASILSGAGLEVVRCGYIFFGLIGPKVVAGAVGKLSDRDGVHTPSAALNNAALRYFRFEHAVAVGRSSFLPAGTSVIAVCRRAGS